ncbi:MAG: DUF1801 domain-containing protein [Caldilineaceae bacterium]|nr:DUF1801 domain-containing protein [Caldilineaceae bacterium]MBP8107311.1 DUF1801 domain-containing protein [Caldilineaceae bacterium]MBP8121686.1 DUF1801 domain-containing protein [Caldilineaceae bacterium]MBP9071614.1 DUF1801 domain-containing protein [Caldilineaceae bacterium]
MQSKASTVDQYLTEVPAKRMEALQRLRDLCVTHLTGYEESMVYGMPSYSKKGTVEVSFASQKQYISLYILKQEVFDRHRPALAGLNLGKGCIRYTRPEKIDFAVVEQLLADTAASDAEIC